MVAIEAGTPMSQLAQKPAPFVLELPIRDADAWHCVITSELRLIKTIATRARLGVDDEEVTVDRRPREPATPKTLQLRVGSIALGSVSKNLAREQCFAPKGDKPPCVKILRVQTPKSHEIAAGLTKQRDWRGIFAGGHQS